MKKKQTFLFLLTVLILLPLNYSHAYDVEYYVDCQNGSDASDGTSEVNAWLTIQHAADTVTNAGGSTRVNIEWDSVASECDITATVDFDTNTGSEAAPIIFQGYGATIGDGTLAVVDGQSTATNIFNIGVQNIYFKDIEIKNSTSHGIVINANGDRTHLERIKVSSAGANGIDVQNNAFENYIYGCDITADNHGIDDEENGVIAYNYIHDTGARNIYQTGSTSPSFVFRNIFDTTSTDDNVNINADKKLYYENTLYNASDNNLQTSSGTNGFVAINNIFDTSGSINTDINASTTQYIVGYNSYFDGTGGTGSFNDGFNLGNDITSDPGLDNTLFTVGANAQNAGYFPSTQYTASINSYTNIGAVQNKTSTGGASTNSYGFSF